MQPLLPHLLLLLLPLRSGVCKGGCGDAGALRHQPLMQCIAA
jgi:hypothetical protein